ncbi:LuxR C-terminal-related transcriptional regulator [Phenylobacterium sp.]|uniref:LuxR C-terminal-related transcriptional regulator n=1 Tax=Phenylobacterium sp. TaxID=1871053 RepID=UPI0035AD9639
MRIRRSSAGLRGTPGQDEAYANAAIETVPIPAAVTDEEGVVLAANRRLLDLLGLPGSAPAPRLRLPLPGAAPTERQEVRTGSVTLSRWNGRLISPMVVAVGVGGRGWMLYLVTDVSPPKASSEPADGPGTSEAAARLSLLTSRETEVLRLLITDGSNKAVARALGISPRTVEVHRSRVLRKLGVTSLTQAFAVALAAGLDGGRAGRRHGDLGAVDREGGGQAVGASAAYSLQFR